MIDYIVAHYKMSLFLLVPVLFLLKSEILSNKVRLYLLYAALIKAVLPWGVLSFPVSFIQKDGMGTDYLKDMAIEAAGVSSAYTANAYSYESFMITICLLLSAIYLSFNFSGLFSLNAKIKRSVICDDKNIYKLAEEMIFTKACRVRILVSDEVRSPLIWWEKGWVIVLSKTVVCMAEADIKAVLAHEFAHIKRYDLVKYLLLMVVKSLFLVSPFVYFLVGKIIEHEETEADLLAIRLSGITPNSFGKTILKLLSVTNHVNNYVPALGMKKKRRLTMRLKRLFERERSKKNRFAAVCVSMLALGIMTFNFTSIASTLSDADSLGFINPVKNGRVTQMFGQRQHPITKKDYFHKGIDLAAKKGTDVEAAAAGNVAVVDYNEKQGHYIVISHKDGYSSSYSHLGKVVVSAGSIVRQGEVIAKLGNSGVSTGPHVHFEIRKDGEAVDPAEHFSKK